MRKRNWETGCACVCVHAHTCVYTYTQIFIDSRQNNEVIKEENGPKMVLRIADHGTTIKYINEYLSECVLKLAFLGLKYDRSYKGNDC